MASWASTTFEAVRLNTMRPVGRRDGSDNVGRIRREDGLKNRSSATGLGFAKKVSTSQRARAGGADGPPVGSFFTTSRLSGSHESSRSTPVFAFFWRLELVFQNPSSACGSSMHVFAGRPHEECPCRDCSAQSRAGPLSVVSGSVAAEDRPNRGHQSGHRGRHCPWKASRRARARRAGRLACTRRTASVSRMRWHGVFTLPTLPRPIVELVSAPPGTAPETFAPFAATKRLRMKVALLHKCIQGCRIGALPASKRCDRSAAISRTIAGAGCVA